MREIRTEIDIVASATCVWRALTDFELYPEWNPFIRRVSGQCIDGGELRVTTASLFGILLNFQLKVDNILENRGMRWLGQTLMAGLLDGHHYFEIHEMSPEKVRFIQYEEFSGCMLPLAWPMIAPLSRKGFDSMNKALKKKVEQDVSKASK